MRPTLPVLLAALSATLLPQVTEASSSVIFQITAHVDTFCRISTPDELPITLVNGTAQIGMVHEICNTPNGYDVMANFSNLSGGELNVAGQNYPIDNDGHTVRSSTNPDIRDQNWQLADAIQVMPNTPVVMRVTISPR
jgi:hypothetical protein